MEKEECEKNLSPQSVLELSSGKDLDLCQTEICSFLCFEIETFQNSFYWAFHRKFIHTETEAWNLKNNLNVTATVLIDFIYYLLLFSVLLLISLSLIPSCQSWD